MLLAPLEPRARRKREPDAAFLIRVAEQFRRVAADCDQDDIKQKLFRIAAKAERLTFQETPRSPDVH